MKITEQVWAFSQPIVEQLGCSIWDVEYVREGADWFLRIYLDKPGGVTIDDCEAVSRAIDPVLDEKDPIENSYTFEVCSAGLERVLKRPRDFHQALSAQKRQQGIQRPPSRLRGRTRHRRGRRRNHDI